MFGGSVARTREVIHNHRVLKNFAFRVFWSNKQVVGPKWSCVFLAYVCSSRKNLHVNKRKRTNKTWSGSLLRENNVAKARRLHNSCHVHFVPCLNVCGVIWLQRDQNSSMDGKNKKQKANLVSPTHGARCIRATALHKCGMNFFSVFPCQECRGNFGEIFRVLRSKIWMSEA